MKQKQLLYFIYEGGMEYNSAFRQLINSYPGIYDRLRARNLISVYLEKNVHTTNGNTHPIFLLEPKQVNELIDFLTTESKGGKVNILPTGPSIW